MGTVATLPRASAKGGQTRRRILEVAQDAILAKGFDATSIEEIVAAAEITKSGFFYHFRDKNELARALLEWSIDVDRDLLSDVFRRGHELSEDPLHAFLIGLKLFAEVMADMPNGHPGCIVTTVCYQERLFDSEVRALNRQVVLNWRAHFLAEIEAVAERYPPREPVDLVSLADMLSTTVEGGIVMAKALGQPHLLAEQILLQRTYIKLLFSPELSPAGPPFLCVGAAHWDIIARTAAPLPPGADVPGRVSRQPGGVAQNVARALAALGRPVALLSAIGRDRAGDELAAGLAAAGIDCAGLLRHDGPADCYLAIEGAGGALHAGVADCTGLERAGLALLAPLDDGRRRGPAVLDGNLPPPVLEAALRHPALAAAPLALVPASPEKAARLAPFLALRPATLYLNRLEAEALCARPFPDSRAAAEALRAAGAAHAIVTDGARPAASAGPLETITLPPPPVTTASVTGAGDVFVAAHLAARADGLDPETALRTALTAAARHITCEAP